MDYEIKSKVEPKVEFLPLENLTKITCPKNSEGTIHLVVDIEYNFHLVIEENAHWTINVEYEKGLIIANNTIEVKEYATLKHNIICYEEIFELTANQKINLASNAEYTSALLDVSESNVNFVNNISLDGIYASSYFRSAVVSSKEAKKLYEISTLNNAIYTSSKMDNYGVCKDNSKLEFKGIGTIKKGFKQSNNHQNSKIIVFDELSNASVYPLLYIDEYDVLASHSAAVGKVNDEHMYYLCSRGLNEEQAREFITMGYLIPVLDYFLDQDIKTKAQKTLERRVSNV